MITIAPREIAEKFIPGQKVKLMNLISACDARDHVNPRVTVRGVSHRIPDPRLPITRIKSKYYYQNCCWVSMGKCDRCRAQECTDRDWRKRGYVP